MSGTRQHATPLPSNSPLSLSSPKITGRQTDFGKRGHPASVSQSGLRATRDRQLLGYVRGVHPPVVGSPVALAVAAVAKEGSGRVCLPTNSFLVWFPPTKFFAGVVTKSE